MSLLAESSPRSRTWRANLNATSVTTITPPNPSSGPTATPHIASLLIPFHLLQATRAIKLERPTAATVLVRFDLFFAKFASDSTRGPPWRFRGRERPAA